MSSSPEIKSAEIQMKILILIYLFYYQMMIPFKEQKGIIDLGCELDPLYVDTSGVLVIYPAEPTIF